MSDFRSSDAAEPVLSILHLEDNSLDAEMVRDRLIDAKVRFQIERVQSRADFVAALHRSQFDLILSDFTLPSFDGLSALDIARGLAPETPFIFLSGTIGEEQAIESLKRGAVDYVIKDRLHRLVPAVQRARREAQQRAERVRIEEELRQRNELFRQITENVEDLISVLDLNGRRVYNSPSYQELLNHPALLDGADFFATIHPEDRERIRGIFEKTIRTGSGDRTEYRFQLEDGACREIESQDSVIRDQAGTITNVIVVSRDVTERRKIELKLQEQAALLDRAQDAIFVSDLDRRISYWNKGAERLYEWAASEVLGQAGPALAGSVDLPDREEISRTLLRTGDWQEELAQSSKSGRPITVISRRTLIRGPRGEPSAVLHINTDITEKKQLEAQFLRSQRLENIGALASGIAHDLNNVLAPILMAADLLSEEVASPSGTKLLDVLRQSTNRGSEMVKHILSFTRGVTKYQPIDVRELVHEALKLIRATFPRQIQIQTELGRSLKNIQGNPTQLQQVLMNLCVNARDAMPQGGLLQIAAKNMQVKSKKFSRELELVSGDFVELSIADTGIGIPEHLLQKIFEPFYTTKDPEKGTGLGLASVLNIVTNHRGHIEIESTEGEGTTFRVYLPASDPNGASGVGARESPIRPGNQELVLLIDDESAILEIAKLMLENHNYRILTAADGLKGLLVFQEHQRDISLVITDITMPLVDGVEVIKELKRMQPRVKIICATGIGFKSRVLDEVSGSIAAFVDKPYAPTKLLAVISEVLARQA